MEPSTADIARILADALALTLPPIAVSLTEAVPPGVPAFEGRVSAGCVFWQEATRRTFATAPRDHDLCAIGTFTHNLEATAAHEADHRDALAVFAGLKFLGAFHTTRRRDVEAGGAPTIKQSLARLPRR